jgi:C4-dicarboxylate-specific signal transduction histidine kinase
MNTISDNLMGRKELEFYGRITASISHELNNILSIINEYSGLLDDLVLAVEKGKSLDENKIQKIAQNISEQIKRQRDIIKLLNKFAHRADTPITKFNLNELVNDITRLTQRFASLKKVNLVSSLPNEDITLTNNPFALQQIIFLCFDMALESSNPNDNISIHFQNAESNVIIEIISPPVTQETMTSDKFDFLTNLSKNINSELIISKTNDNLQLFKICVPFSISQKNAVRCEED